MSYKKNDCQQISFNDSFSGLTTREQKALENSWAEVFSNELFPNINEDIFSVLYSDKASRPNTPVNVIVGALIIKELFDYSDDEMVEGLMLDIRLQYALHTTSCAEQPLSDKTLSRFRKRCYDYETLTGIDLYHECVGNLGGAMAKIMDISGRSRRMDSMMIESNIRRLSRMELLYQCVSRMAVAVNKKDKDLLPDDLKHYTDPDDFNKVVYHQHSTDSEERIAQIIKDGETLLDLCKDTFSDTAEYELLVRCFSEQTIVDDGKRRLRTKEDGKISSSSLQSPTDPDATYHKKAGKEHIGYAANVEESVGENGSVITDYQYEPNTQSDEQFLKDRLEQMDKEEEPVTLVTDGAYSGKENTDLAKEKNVDLVTTNLKGTPADDIAADFELSEDGTKVLHCPAGHEPKKCTYEPSNQRIRATFDRDQCASCPYHDQCKAQIFKRVAVLYISANTKRRAEIQRFMKTDRFQELSRFRNGIETVPSNLRRNYHLDKLPRGKQRGKFFFGSKIAALNFTKLLTYRRGTGNYAQNPVIS